MSTLQKFSMILLAQLNKSPAIMLLALVELLLVAVVYAVLVVEVVVAAERDSFISTAWLLGFHGTKDY